MIKVLFICHGNICRSPMAEFIFKKMVKEAGLENEFIINSAATSTEEIYNGVGNDMYPPAKAKLKEKKIPFEKRRARQLTMTDCSYYDYLVLMDRNNIRNFTRMFNGAYVDKTSLLMSYAGEDRDVSDPWYTDDFETAYNDISKGCRALLNHIQGA